MIEYFFSSTRDDGKNDLIVVIYDQNYEEEFAEQIFRLAEYIENADFAGKTFLVEEFKEAYRDGSWTYPTDWSGFNHTHKHFKDFRKAFKGMLTEEETKFHNEVDEMLKLGEFADKWYFIAMKNKGCIEDLIETFRHELVHAFYDLNQSFKRKCKFLLKKIRACNTISMRVLEETLNQMGYHGDVLDTEVIAYCSGQLPHQFEAEFNSKYFDKIDDINVFEEWMEELRNFTSQFTGTYEDLEEDLTHMIAEATYGIREKK